MLQLQDSVVLKAVRERPTNVAISRTPSLPPTRCMLSDSHQTVIKTPGDNEYDGDRITCADCDCDLLRYRLDSLYLCLNALISDRIEKLFLSIYRGRL